MSSILPIIPISQLQREAHKALKAVERYAVVRSHSHDVAFVLHPTLGKILLESGMLEKLVCLAECAPTKTEEQISLLIGSVLRELSKK